MGIETERGPDQSDEQHRMIWDKRHAEGWGVNKTDQEREKYLLDFLKNHRSEIGPRVLDAGCGPGNCTALLAAEGLDVTAVDVSSNAIKNARERLKDQGLSANLEVGDLQRLRFKDGEFDSVVNMHVLSHFSWEQAKQASAELVRVLKPGGLFFLRVHSASDERRKDIVRTVEDNQDLPESERGRGYIRQRPGEEPYAIHSYSLGEIQWLAKQNSLEFVEEPLDERTSKDGQSIPGQWNVVFRKEVKK